MPKNITQIQKAMMKLGMRMKTNNVAATAQSYALKILQCCRVHSTQADELDLKQALTALASGQIDFNDALLVDICKKQDFKLMTNDADFQCGGIEFLTTNPKLLKACSS